MGKIVLLLVCLAVFQMASALKCYHCDGPKCEDQKDWQTTECKGQEGNICLKHVYKDKNNNQKETVSRKCAILPKGEEKFKCSNTVGEEISCVTCDKDLCNSAAKINFSVVALSSIFLALLVPKFMA